VAAARTDFYLSEWIRNAMEEKLKRTNGKRRAA
jgi:hypothetical protein